MLPSNKEDASLVTPWRKQSKSRPERGIAACREEPLARALVELGPEPNEVMREMGTSVESGLGGQWRARA